MTTEPWGTAPSRSRERAVVLYLLVALLVTLVPWGFAQGASAAAKPKTKEPRPDSAAWYWEEQRVREFEQDGNIVRLEVPNPYCPAPPGGVPPPESSCAEGRLPIEIRNGDYETPNKLSAIAFDLSEVPAGSKIKEFTVTFLEAKAGCYRSDGTVRCEQTDPVNVAGHKLQACLVTEYFGEGVARPYEEMPRYKCSDDDPIAERVLIKGESPDRDGDGTGPEADHEWTFDLTAYAQEWKSEFAAATGVMITGATPKRTEAEGGPTDTWSVVLKGPKKGGIATKIVYTPPKDPVPPVPPVNDPPDVPPPTSSVPPAPSDFGTSDTDFGSDPSDEGADTPTTPTDETETPVEAEESEPTSAAQDTPEVETLPGYVWLVIIAGLIGFSLVRAAVVESTSGARADGVLAQIRKLNTQRRGADIVSADSGSAGPAAAMLAAVRTVGGRAVNAVKSIRIPRFGRR